MEREEKTYFQLILDRDTLDIFRSRVSDERRDTKRKLSMTSKLVEMIKEYNERG